MVYMIKPQFLNPSVHMLDTGSYAWLSVCLSVTGPKLGLYTMFQHCWSASVLVGISAESCKIKDTWSIWCKSSKNLRFLDIRACNSAMMVYCRLKVLWAFTYTTAMQPHLFHFILDKSTATSWTWNYVSHPSIYSITLFIEPTCTSCTVGSYACHLSVCLSVCLGQKCKLGKCS